MRRCLRGWACAPRRRKPPANPRVRGAKTENAAACAAAFCFGAWTCVGRLGQGGMLLRRHWAIQRANAGPRQTARSPDRRDRENQGQHPGQGRPPVPGDQASIRPCQGEHRGLAKNTVQPRTLFALANLWMVRRKWAGPGHECARKRRSNQEWSSAMPHTTSAAIASSSVQWPSTAFFELCRAFLRSPGEPRSD